MESKKEKIFPWIKDVLQSFASSFMLDYDIDVLSTLHRNIDKEINMIYSSNDQTIERTEALYKEITYIYEHMRLKISQHPECQNATLSCVKLISQLIRVGLILTQGLINSEWIERILTALELFPGGKVLVYDALFLVNGLKKIHQKPYCAILRHIMTEDHHEFVTDPLIYMEIILLFRRLKALVLNRYKEKYNILVTKIKPPSNLISWLASLDVNGYSPYLKKLKYKKIAQQLMKKALPESFIKKIRYMALNQYNFEIEDSELKIIETKNQPSSMFIIDNTSSTKCDNLDMLENSQKAITKKKTNSQAKRKRKKLLLNENIENDDSPQSNRENETSNICINESGIDNNTHKHFSKPNKHAIVSKKKQKSNLSNSKERIIVSKKKKKSKSNLVKNPKSKTPTNLSDDVSDSDLFFQDVEGSTLLHDIDGSTLFHVNKSTLNTEDPESSSENKISILYINESDRNVASNKHSPNSIEHLTVSKKKKKLKSKNTKSCTSVTLNNDESNSDLFYYDVENSSISEQLNKNTQNYKDPESSSKIKVSNVYIDNSDTDQTTHKNFPSSNEHIVSKKKKKSKCNLIKNTDSEPSAVHSEDVPDSALFFHDVKGSSNSKKLKTTYNISNSNVPPKRDLSEDTDTLDKNVSKNKNHKKLKSSKYNETTISDNSISSNNKLDSNTVSHQQLLSENKNNKQKNTFKDNEDIIFVTEISAKKRKKVTSKDDSASDDKCIYFKKLMLQKVSDKSRTTSTEISNEPENINSAVTVDDYAKLPDITEKNKNVTENNLCENQSVHLENVGVKNLEKENAIVNESLSVTENTVYENQTVCLKNIANKNFEEERNVICNIPSDHSDKFNDSIHPKIIDNLSAEKENNLTVQSSEKTKLLIEPKIADESSTLGASTQTTEASTQTTEASAQTTEDSTQTTEESDKNIVDNLNSEWIEEDNLVKNKQFNVLLLKSDVSIASVSNVECKDVENKHNMKESRETLKSNQIANKESRTSTEHPSAKDVSENIPVPSQNVDVKNSENNTPEKDMHSNKYTFNITDCADLPITAKGVANQIQQISEPNAHICIAESNACIDSSSCENSIIAEHNENLNTFSVEKTLYSTTLDESSFKANLKSVDTQVSLEQENEKYISAIHDNILPPTSPSDSMQSEGKSLLNDSHSTNVVNNEYSVENSSVFESESKLESKENSSENICSNEFDKAHFKNVDKNSTLIDDVSENNILHSIDEQDKSVQNMQTNVNTKLKLEKYIDTGNDVAGDSENCEYKTVCVETTPVSSEEQHVCFDSKKVEESYVLKENSLECESSKSLNIKEKLLITEISTLGTQIKHDGLSTNLSIKTTVSDKEDNEIGPKLENVENANQKCVEKGTDFQATRKTLHPSEDKEVNDHVEDHAEHSVISIVKKQKEKSEMQDAQALDKLNDEKISSMLVNETSVHKNSVQLKSIDSQNDIISNENNERIVSTESILVSNELACLDTVSNSVNDVKIAVKNKEYTMQVVESEKVSDVCKNSEKTSVSNSQKDIVKDNKNSTRNLSNEITLSSNVSACSDNMCNSVTNDETSIKVELQPLLESKNVVITCENSDKLKVVSSQDDIIISNENNEKDLSNENIRSSNECSNKINNSLYDVKTLIEIMGSTIHLLPLVEKPIDACENSGMFKAVNSQDESILGNENCERNSSSENILSLKESTSSDNIDNPENDVKIVESTVHLLPVIEKPIDAHENSDQLNSINSQNYSLINFKNNERDLSNENISSLKESSSSDNVGNPENDVKIVESTVHLLPVIEKPIDAHENSDQLNSIDSQYDSLIDIKNNERDLSNENISSLKESISSDNIGNPENDVKIVESTVHLLPVIEKPIDAHENSDQLNSIDSQNDSLIDIKNNERDLSNENISSLKESSSSDNVGNPENDVKIVESTVHLLPVIEKPIDAHENSDQLNSINSQNDSLIDIKNNERDLSNENISSLKESISSDNIGNPENDVKIVESTVHLLPVIEKPVGAHENSDQLNSINSQNDSLIDIKNNERDLSKENISSLKESTNSDNLDNAANNVQIVESTIHLLPVIVKTVDACENSDQLKAVNSQNDTIIGNEKNLLIEDIPSSKECSDNINNSANDFKLHVEITKNTIHSVPVIEKHIVAYENSDKLKAVVNSQVDDVTSNEKDLLNENSSSSKEGSDNMNNSAADIKVSSEIAKNTIHSVPVIDKHIVAYKNSDKLKAVNFQDDDVTSNEKDLLNENSSSSKEGSDNMNNSAADIRVSSEIMKNAIHSLPVIEKPTVACKNSVMLKVVNSQDGNENDLSNKNISSQKESTSSDNIHNSENNIHNSENDVKISVELTNSTIPSLPLIEQLVDICENSYQLNAVNSQNDRIRDDENNEKDLSNENDVASSVKEKEDSLQLLESKNVEETPLNTENSSSRKIAIEVKNSNVCAKSNLNEHEKSCERMLKDNEREKSCERMSKDNESDADCNFDLQERYIVLDESYSDVDDCKSNYSEQSNENSSPLKKFVTTTNKSKFKSPSSSDPSSRHVCENYNEQIEPVVKKNIPEVLSLQKSTNEMDSIESPIKIDATNKSEIKSDISSSDDNSNHLHEKDTSEVSHGNYTNDIDSTTSPVNAIATNDSKFKGDISSIEDCHKHLCVKDTSEVSHGNYTNDIDSTTSPVNAIATNESKFKGDISSIEDCHKHLCVKDDHQIKPILKKDTSEVSHENCASGTDSKNSRDSNLSNIKKSLSLIGNGIEHSLQDSNSREKVISVVQSQCSSSVLETESSKKEIKFAEIGEQSIKRMKGKNIKYSSEVSESLSVPSFCGDENRDSFTEISIKGKDKSLDIKSIGPVPVNRFPCDPSTEFFRAYKNKLVNDKDNKTKSSLISKDQSFTEIPFKDTDKNIDIESVDSVPINNFSSAASTELCKNKLTDDENNKTKASLSSRDQSFTEIPIKDKDIDIETVGSVAINNSSSAASTESYGMYRNELTNDEDNKTEASLSSRDDIFSNCQENDEIISQTLSSDRSDDDCDSRCSSQEEGKESMSDDTIIPSEDCNDQSKTIDESLSFKNNVPSTAETENDSLDNKTCANDKSLSGLNVSDSLDSTHEKNSVTSVFPRQSLRLKTKAESKCQTDSEEISTSDNSKIDEVSKKELKLVLTDCRSSLKSENNTNSLSNENIFSCPLTHDNNEDIISSQTSVIKKNTSTAKDKSKESSTDPSKSAKRYSLRHRKSNQPRDDSANLGIDLNKLKFDSPKSTRSRRNSKYVQMLTSPSEDIKLQDNPSDVIPSKRETRSSAKTDVGIESNTPGYNLRNRKAIIAPPKFNV